MDEQHRRGSRSRRRALVALTTCVLLGLPLGAGAPASAAPAGWTPPAVLVPAPATPDLAATSAGDSTWVFAGDRVLRGVRGRWTAARTPYRGARMLSATADATGAVVAFETLDRGVPQHRGHQLLVGRRSWSGRWSTPVEVAQPVNSGPLPPPALLAQGGRWRAFFNEADCVDTACGGNVVFEVTDTGARRRLASVPGGRGELEGQLVPLDAALLPGGVVALVGRDDDSLDGGSAVRDRGPLWFGRGEAGSWRFALLDPRTDVTSSDVVGRDGGLFVAYGRPGQVVERTSDGRRWAAPRTLPASGRPRGVLTAVSLGRQFLAWSDDRGLHLASRTRAGTWSSTTVTRAGRPRSLALTAVDGRATVVYGVTTAGGLEVRAQSQR